MQRTGQVTAPRAAGDENRFFPYTYVRIRVTKIHKILSKFEILCNEEQRTVPARKGLTREFQYVAIDTGCFQWS